MPDLTTELLAYDDNGNVTQKTNRSGLAIGFSFDALNRETSRSVPDNPGVPGNYARTLTSTYDLASRKYDTTADGQTLQHRYDGTGRLNLIGDTQLNALGASVGNVSYSYDASSNRASVGFTAVTQGTWTAGYDYDAGERLWHITAGASTLATYGYDALSRVTSTGYYDATSVALTYEADDDLATLTHTYSGGSLAFGYAHNGAHQLTTLTSNLASYITHQTTPSNSYSTNALNQYTQMGAATLTYDANGNLTGDGVWTYRYDEENRLRQAVGPGMTVDYGYDPDGRRRSKSVNGTVTYFVSDGANELAELSSSGARLRLYLNGDGMDAHVGMYEDAGGTGWAFYHANHQGSVVMTTRYGTSGAIEASYNYGAFGESTDPNTGNAFRYTGRYLDAESGLYYYRARYYSPKLGRFLQTDPIGTKDDLNLYAYVGNDPLNRADPLGTYSCGSSMSGDQCQDFTKAQDQAKQQISSTVGTLKSIQSKIASGEKLSAGEQATAGAVSKFLGKGAGTDSKVLGSLISAGDKMLGVLKTNPAIHVRRLSVVEHPNR